MYKRAQGTIEYLVILAVIVVIALIVVSLMVNSTAPAASVSEQQSELFWKAQPISIVESVADFEGDAILTLKANEQGTIDKLEIDGLEYDVEDTRLNLGGEIVVFLTGLNGCVAESGVYEIKIYYYSQEGLQKVVSGRVELVVGCVGDVSVDNIVSESFLTGNHWGQVRLLSPSDGSYDVDGVVDFSFNTNGENLSECFLMVGGVAVGQDVSSPFDSFQYSLPSQGTYVWDVVCTFQDHNVTSLDGPWEIIYGAGPLTPMDDYLLVAQGLGSLIGGDFADSVDVRGSAGAITGTFEGTSTFGSVTIDAISSQEIGIPIAKFNLDRNDWLWATQIDFIGAGYGQGHGAAIDSSGDVYAVGLISGSANVGSLTLNPVGNEGFIVKVDGDTNAFLWGTHTNGVQYTARAWDVAISADGHPIMAGTMDTDTYFGDIFVDLAGSNRGIFVAKLDKDTNEFLWVAHCSGADYLQMEDLKVDSSGNIYVTGAMRGNTTCGGYSMNLIGSDDIYVAKLDSSGNWQWAKNSGGSGYDTGGAVAVDNSGNVYFAGHFRGTASFAGLTFNAGPNNGDVVIGKYDSSGNWVWATRTVNTSYTYPTGLDLDSSGNLWVTGGFSGTAYFGTIQKTASNNDIFLAKINPDTNQWLEVNQEGSPTQNDYVSDISIGGSSDSIFSVGGYSGSDFELGGITAPPHQGMGDIFVWKYTPN